MKNAHSTTDFARERLLDEASLGPYGPVRNLADRAHALFRQQRESWPLLAEGVAGLDGAATRSFEFDGCVIKAQHNPARMRSTAARVDEESVRGRACFLCPSNLPPEQRGIRFERDFLVLCNPYPIFPEHFTIVHRRHLPQRIGGEVATLLELSRELGARYSVLYNGPACGASAPDHLHFQATSFNVMPLENDYERVLAERGRVVLQTVQLRVIGIAGRLRRFFAVEASDAHLARDAIRSLLAVLAESLPAADEPMVNLIAGFNGSRWRILIFPRTAHRPSFYGEDGFLISPAAADLGGLLVVPRGRDFRMLDAGHVERLFNEVGVAPEAFRLMSEQLRPRLGLLSRGDRAKE